MSEEANFIALSPEDEELNNTILEAQNNIKWFKQAYKDTKFEDAMFMIKAGFRDTNSEEELIAHFWLFVLGIEEDGIYCVTDKIPEEFGGLESKQRLFLKDEYIEDWSIYTEGHLYGGYSTRYLRSLRSDDGKKQFDTEMGITVYEKLP